MRHSRRLLIAVAPVLVPLHVFAQTPVTHSQTTGALQIACFSPQRAFAASADGKAAIARLAVLRTEKEREITDKSRALQAQEQALQQSSSLLSDAARAQRSADVEKLRIDVQRFIEDARAELMGVQREAENAFLVKARPALTKVVRDRGFQIVLNADDDQVVWFDPTVDVTVDVVKQLAAKQ